MLKLLLAGFVLAAAPAAVFAQSTTHTGSSAGTTSSAAPGPSGNLNNPQAETNMAGQPGNARTLPSSGDAKRMPVPVVNGQTLSSPIPQPQKPPSSRIIH